MFGCMRQGSTDGSGGRVRSPRKQRVQLQLMELEGVTLSNGILFAKVRLLGGGRSCQYSARKEIRDNKVTWTDQGPMEFAFRCARPSAAAAAPAALRVSVRKEERGGRSYSKLGYAVLDLAGLSPGGAATEHSCILSPYSQHQRLDNSTLRLQLRRLACQQQQPQQQPPAPSLLSSPSPAAAVADPLPPPGVAVATAAGGEMSTSAEAAVAAAAATESAVNQLATIAVDASTATAATAAVAAAAPHRRNPSSFSFASMRTHSRTNSLEQDAIMLPATSSQSSSVPSFDLLPSSSLERKRAAQTPSRELSSRIANTRADNYKLVREVLEQEGIRLVGLDASG